MKMDTLRLTGPQAASAKYDVLTALSAIGLHRGGGAQASVLRLILLITARYNWRADELCVPQRDMARMWGVTERTVKREVKAWLDGRLVICKRQGVRGRAGAYRLDMVEIWQQASDLWPLIGPDYAERMTPQPVATNVITADFAQIRDETRPEPGSWRAVSRRLKLIDAAMHAAWIAPLRLTVNDAERVELTAPTRFAAHYIETHLRRVLDEAVEAEMGPGRRIVVRAEGA